MIAEGSAYSPSWDRRTGQRSDKLFLEAGVPYYLEAQYKEYGGGDFVQIGVEFFDVPISAGTIDGAVNEKQKVIVASTVQQEVQVIQPLNFRYLFWGCSQICRCTHG